MKYEIYSTVDDGNLKQNRNLIIDALKSFEGKGIVITIEKRKNKRSNPQNAYFHGVVLPLVYNGLKELGHTMPLADVKDLLKLKFLKVPIFVNEETGEITEKIKNTSELTTIEFMEFVSEIQRWSSENLGVNIPDPNQNIKLEI
jgi:tagatose-1,6-bisphosphate aldolase